jgi:hypothetical protein
MSTWNYRVLRKTHTDANAASYDIHEVYYREDGEIDGWTAESVRPYGEMMEELREDLRYLLHAFRRPVLEEQQIDGHAVLVEDAGDAPINAGHYFEFMDRAAVATDYVYQFLGSHPLIKKEPRLSALYDKAEAALAKLYQEASRLEFDRNGS